MEVLLTQIKIHNKDSKQVLRFLVTCHNMDTLNQMVKEQIIIRIMRHLIKETIMFIFPTIITTTRLILISNNHIMGMAINIIILPTTNILAILIHMFTNNQTITREMICKLSTVKIQIITVEHKGNIGHTEMKEDHNLMK